MYDFYNDLRMEWLKRGERGSVRVEIKILLSCKEEG